MEKEYKYSTKKTFMLVGLILILIIFSILSFISYKNDPYWEDLFLPCLSLFLAFMPLIYLLTRTKKILFIDKDSITWKVPFSKKYYKLNWDDIKDIDEIIDSTYKTKIKLILKDGTFRNIMWVERLSFNDRKEIIKVLKKKINFKEKIYNPEILNDFKEAGDLLAFPSIKKNNIDFFTVIILIIFIFIIEVGRSYLKTGTFTVDNFVFIFCYGLGLSSLRFITTFSPSIWLSKTGIYSKLSNISLTKVISFKNIETVGVNSNGTKILLYLKNKSVENIYCTLPIHKKERTLLYNTIIERVKAANEA